ncbi:hypothetical protein ACFE04_024726 [Oxalis oulophora]
MEVMYYQLANSSYQDSLKLLEADLQHANALAAAIPRGKSGGHLQMKLVYNHWAPIILYLLQWMDSSCTCLLPTYLNFFNILIYKVYADGRSTISTHGRKASIREFYAVILPSLQRLHGNLELLNDARGSLEMVGKKKKVVDEDFKPSSVDIEREDECGICLEPCTKVVLPNCCHAMCIKCYRNWNSKSESCPFCRGNIKRVNSEDLWVLTCNNDVVDTETVTREDLLRFYLYINSLPKDTSDSLSVVYYEYLI